tara:strand:- start:1805 stop:2104 length:300 start_codon:yes stop_codon:yes gene_type:complete
MKSEEKLLKEMGVSFWSLKNNFSFDGQFVTKKEQKKFSKQDLKFLKSLSISFRQRFSDIYPDRIMDFLSAKNIQVQTFDDLKKISPEEKRKLLINIEKN